MIESGDTVCTVFYFAECYLEKGEFFGFFLFFVRYSTLFHLPHWFSDALTTRLDLIHKLFKTFKHSLSIYYVKKYVHSQEWNSVSYFIINPFSVEKIQYYLLFFSSYMTHSRELLFRALQTGCVCVFCFG
jgi:hypothetical protein